MQCLLPRLLNDTSLNLPLSQYQQTVDTIAKRVIQVEFSALVGHGLLLNSAQNAPDEPQVSDTVVTKPVVKEGTSEKVSHRNKATRGSLSVKTDGKKKK